MSWRDELSENVWVEGTLRLEYGKAGIYNSNRLPAEKEEKKKEKEKEKIPGIGRYPMGPTMRAQLNKASQTNTSTRIYEIEKGKTWVLCFKAYYWL